MTAIEVEKPAIGVNQQEEEEDKELWTIECTVDELQLNLCQAKEQITLDKQFYVDGVRQTKTVSIHKYYRQALELIKRIEIARPPPEFVINVRDLAVKTIKELEFRADDPPIFAYILKQAVGHIFENLDSRRYHLSIARNLKVRLEP